MHRIFVTVFKVLLNKTPVGHRILTQANYSPKYNFPTWLMILKERSPFSLWTTSPGRMSGRSSSSRGVHGSMTGGCHAPGPGGCNVSSKYWSQVTSPPGLTCVPSWPGLTDHKYAGHRLRHRIMFPAPAPLLDPGQISSFSFLQLSTLISYTHRHKRWPCI